MSSKYDSERVKKIEKFAKESGFIDEKDAKYLIGVIKTLKAETEK